MVVALDAACVVSVAEVVRSKFVVTRRGRRTTALPLSLVVTFSRRVMVPSRHPRITTLRAGTGSPVSASVARTPMSTRCPRRIVPPSVVKTRRSERFLGAGLTVCVGEGEAVVGAGVGLGVGEPVGLEGDVMVSVGDGAGAGAGAGDGGAELVVGTGLVVGDGDGVGVTVAPHVENEHSVWCGFASP